MKKFLKRVLKTIIYIIFSLLCVYLTTNISKILSANGKISKAEQNLKTFQKENYELRQELQEVQKGQFLEKQARDKLGLAKEGEVVLVLPGREIIKKANHDYQKPVETADVLPNWQKWLKLIF